MSLDQIAILICSILSIYFISGKKPLLGFWIGLAGQPFWLYSSYTNQQWGIFVLAFWYGFCYYRGIRKETNK